jgi:replicative DNA helicase
MGRETLRPQRTDIANSSKAENAADALCIFHRESVVMQGGKINHADISIEKNRSGPSSSQIYDLYFDEQTGKISEMPYQGSML